MGFLGFLKKREDDKAKDFMPLNQDSNISDSTDTSFDIPLPEEREYDSKILEPDKMEEGIKPGVIDDMKISKGSLPGKKIDEKLAVKEKDDFSDFSLPDFSDEDFNVGSLAQETKEEIKKDAEEKVQASPLLKSSREEVVLNSKKYLDLDNCKKIFDNVGLIQGALENYKGGFQNQENISKNKLQQYKNVHDNLDLVQEKFMEIDHTLFEG
ncbi:MAG: hypothetical protein KJ583_05765 [Nanoarchaeota archaeon]|nr:hypothetical protein [Nanoarchaeota archaeon]MBU1604793.1 hypothetical protein [Nanoarchaeota archaeon]